MEAIESLDTDVSRLITEEDLIDSMFIVCDRNGTGYVHVSSLIDYAEEAMGSANDVNALTRNKLQELIHYLDPGDTNPEVNIGTFRSAISNWIGSLRCDNDLLCELERTEFPRSATGEDDDSEGTEGRLTRSSSFDLLPSNLTTDDLLRADYDSKCLSPVINPESVASPSTTNGETSLTSETTDCDLTELQNKIQRLEFHVKKLTDELEEMRKSLDLADELTLQLTKDNCRLTESVKSHQSNVDRLVDLRKENDEIKASLVVLEELKCKLQENVIQLEQANKTLQQESDDYRIKFSTTSSELDEAQEAIDRLRQLLNDQTEERLKAERSFEREKTKLAERNLALDGVQKRIEELVRMNERLHQNKYELEVQLNETQQCLNAKTVQLNKYESNLGDDSTDEEYNEYGLMSSVMPSLHSTLHSMRNVPSLNQEIRSSIMDDPVYPSPLCDKELETIFSFNTKPMNRFVSIGNASSNSDPDCCHLDSILDVSECNLSMSFNLSSGGKSSRKSVDYLKCLNEKREHLLKDIESIAQSAVQKDAARYNKEVNDLVDHIINIVDAKLTAERRILKLKRILDRYKEQKESDELRLKERKEKLKHLESDLFERLKQLKSRADISGSQPQSTDVKLDDQVDHVFHDTEASFTEEVCAEQANIFPTTEQSNAPTELMNVSIENVPEQTNVSIDLLNVLTKRTNVSTEMEQNKSEERAESINLINFDSSEVQPLCELNQGHHESTPALEQPKSGTAKHWFNSSANQNANLQGKGDCAEQRDDSLFSTKDDFWREVNLAGRNVEKLKSVILKFLRCHLSVWSLCGLFSALVLSAFGVGLLFRLPIDNDSNDSIIKVLKELLQPHLSFRHVGVPPT